MAKKELNSLQGLKKLKVKKKSKIDELLKKQPQPIQPETAPEPDEDSLFFSAMQGVEPMEGNTGRQVNSRPVPPAPVIVDQDRKDAEQFRSVVNGDIDFELEYTDEYMHGYVKGLDTKTFFQLKAGKLSYEGHLDLHGLNAEQAYDTMLFFIKESYLQGKRSVLVIPGRGKNSPGGLSLLRQEMHGWLTRDPLRRVVLAFCTAQPKDGGSGAVYVLLRKHKKTKGKVKWNHMSTFDEEFFK